MHDGSNQQREISPLLMIPRLKLAWMATLDESREPVLPPVALVCFMFLGSTARGTEYIYSALCLLSSSSKSLVRAGHSFQSRCSPFLWYVLAFYMH